MTALTLDGVCKSFGGVVAAEGVTLAIPSGVMTGIIGPNGAGKTTLVNLITGLLRPNAGRIALDGRELTGAGATAVARQGIARTFQNIRLLGQASVLDNVILGFHRKEQASTLSALLALPSSRRETASVRERARALLARFGLSRFAEHPAGSLAYGHQRRVEMMRALAAEPRVLLLDEPVAGMSDVEANELGGVFRTVAESGVAVLVIEHNVRFISEFCRAIYVLDRGRIIAEGEPAAVMSDPAVVSAYLGG